ncbi:MAG: hypothetical protein IJ914_06650 [Prevotella sp.]|nr:hypothetical protein [Prevotella sp.]
MKKKTYLWMLAVIFIYGLGVSCSTEGDVVYLPDPEEQKASTAPLVTVVYDADGVGDQSYNDLIYRGVEETADRYGLRTLQLSPQTNAEGLATLERLFQQMSTANDTIRRLCIVASPVYDEFVRKNSHRLESNQRAALLYLETDTPLESKGSTLYLPYYGAMYEAGNIAPLFASKVTLLGANPVNESVAEAINGFTAGFNDRQATIAATGKEEDGEGFKKGVLTTEYIGKEASEGFAIDDETALLLIDYCALQNQYADLLVPVCGGAANTFARLAEITTAYSFLGVDCEQNSVYSHFSAVKHIDRAVAMCIGQWLSADGMPKHQSLGLGSGYTEVVLHPQNSVFKSLVQRYLPDAVRTDIHQQAIKKESDLSEK